MSDEPSKIKVGRGEIANPNQPVVLRGTTDKVGEDGRRIYLKKIFYEKRAYAPNAAPVDIFVWVIYIGSIRFSGTMFESEEDARQYASNYGFIITPGDPPEPSSSDVPASKEEVDEVDNWFGLKPIPSEAASPDSYCVNCGQKLKVDWKFCIKCGTSQIPT